jgi:hypothetical protein
MYTAKTTTTKPLMNHTEEFKMRCDLSDIEKQLFTLRYHALDYTISKPGEVLAKINAVRAPNLTSLRRT